MEGACGPGSLKFHRPGKTPSPGLRLAGGCRRVRTNPDTTLSLSVLVCSCLFLNIAQAHRHTRRLASLAAPSHFALAPGLTQRRRAVHTNPCRSKQHHLTMTSLHGTDGMAECHDVRNRQAIAGNPYMLGYSAACLRVRMHE
jgi:hypothetical protein